MWNGAKRLFSRAEGGAARVANEAAGSGVGRGFHHIDGGSVYHDELHRFLETWEEDLEVR